MRCSRLAILLCACCLSTACAPAHETPEEGAGTSVSVLFLGDTSLQSHYSDTQSLLRQHGEAYGLEHFREILKSADFTIANFESVLTAQDTSPLQGKKQYIHRDPESLIPMLLQHTNLIAVSLGNNHAMDFGSGGLAETIDLLASNGIAAFGAGKNWDDAAMPVQLQVADLAVAVFGGLEYSRHYDDAYGFFASDTTAGVYALSAETAARIRAYRTAHPDHWIIVFPHWGENYAWASARQRELARSFIDAGANLIIGHGAHQIQEMERINGQWVLYGIGNFLFGSPGRYRRYNAPPFSMIAALHKEPNAAVQLRVYPIHTDNLRNDYQGYFVSEEEFQDIWSHLRQFSPQDGLLEQEWQAGRDQSGFYLYTDLR